MEIKMTDKELIESPILEKRATDWVNEVAPLIYKALEKAGIHYDEEMVCLLLSDGWRIGYASCWRELKGSSQAPV